MKMCIVDLVQILIEQNKLVRHLLLFRVGIHTKGTRRYNKSYHTARTCAKMDTLILTITVDNTVTSLPVS
jgi:hypothetical protein